MNRLWLRNRQRRYPVRMRPFRQMTRWVLDSMLAGRVYEVGVCLLGPTAMSRLNWDFLRHSGPTDVITFNYSEACGPLRADLFLCPAIAVLQAPLFQSDWRLELARYMIHGLLHLSGYDDKTPSTRGRMKQQERRWLTRARRACAWRELGPDLTS